MTFAIVRLYAELALLLPAALLLAAAARALGGGAGRSGVRVGQVLLVAALLLPLPARLLVRPDAMFPAPMQIAGAPDAAVALTMSFAPGPVARAAAVASHGRQAMLGLMLLLLGGSALGLGRLLAAALRLRRLCRAALPLRRVGGVIVAVSAEAASPFTVAFGRRALVIVPEAFVLAPAHLRLAVAHELGHVRAGDTAWTYVTALVTALLPWHPAAHLWARWLGRLQELACDERVAGRPGISPRSYAECLVWAAEVAVQPWRVPALAAPMVEGPRAFLERRIDMVLTRSSRKSRVKVALPVLAAGALGALCGAAALAHGAVADRRVSAADAAAIADELAQRGGLRVPVDASVVDELNQVVGDPTARARFRAGLERLREYRAVGEEALRRHGVPVELVAMAQVESRVQPLPAAQNRLGCAGRWQFTPGTARRYGLRVEAGGVDDRFDPAREVEAAASFLADLHTQFNDWPLAIAAYNNGAPRVRAALAKAAARDAAALVRSGALSNYSSQVLAAILLIQKPALLD